MKFIGCLTDVYMKYYAHNITCYRFPWQRDIGNETVDYGTWLVLRLSSYREIVREAREFILWTVNTVYRRG
jgi:hypothetical protein